MAQVTYKLQHEVPCNWRCIDGSCYIQFIACISVKLPFCWWFKWCTNYCMHYSEHAGVLIVQVSYRLLHAVHINVWCNWRSSVVQINACGTMELMVYWWLKWCTNYCMKHSASSVLLMFHVTYKLLNAVRCNWWCIDDSSEVQLTACSTEILSVFRGFKWFNDYCVQ